LALEDLKKILEELPKSVKFIDASFSGDIFLLRDYVNILKIISTYRKKFSKNFKVFLDCNGWFSGKTTKIISEIKNYVDFLVYSLDGATAQTHDFQRQFKGSFDAVIKSVIESKKNDIETYTSFTVTRINLHEISKFIDLNRKLRVSKCFIRFCANVGRARKNKLPINTKDFFQVFDDIIESLNEENRRKITIILTIPSFYVPDILRILSIKKISFSKEDWFSKNYKSGRLILSTDWCNAYKDKFVVDHKGNVFGCCLMVGFPNLSVGNIKKQHLSKILESRKVKDFIELAKKKPKVCFGCEKYAVCKGCCPLNFFSFDISKRCPFSK
jgi:radical SAM protein with 4Fe4S-binding SPASM domain